MNDQNYTVSFTVDLTPQEIFEHLNNVTNWWATDLKGNSQKMNDEFTVHFGDVHVSTQKITALLPGKKVEWLVTDSNLNFVEDKHEWTNTTISFDLLPTDSKTTLNFTHYGLVPDAQCYTGCSKGWDYYIKGSLFKLLTEGKGTPGLIVYYL